MQALQNQDVILANVKMLANQERSKNVVRQYRPLTNLKRGVSKWSRHKDLYIGSLCLDIGSVPGEIEILLEYREVYGP